MIGLLTNAERSYRFDVGQFHRMLAAGIFIKTRRSSWSRGRLRWLI